MALQHRFARFVVPSKTRQRAKRAVFYLGASYILLISIFLPRTGNLAPGRTFSRPSHAPPPTHLPNGRQIISVLSISLVDWFRCAHRATRAERLFCKHAGVILRAGAHWADGSMDALSILDIPSTICLVICPTFYFIGSSLSNATFLAHMASVALCCRYRLSLIVGDACRSVGG